MNEEALYTIALMQLNGVGPASTRLLIHVFGSAKGVYEHRADVEQAVPEISLRLSKMLNVSWQEELARAEKEVEFAQKNNVELLLMSDERYPSRLRECVDAPLLLFYKGKAELNALRVISIVGTRHCTDYGSEFCARFLADLAQLSPNTLVLSGLAYGIDIHAHRDALKNHLPTVGVLAHGLDRIYPSQHRSTAVKMLENGGLLTEFMTGTQPDRFNFVSRNRIVAGMADAVLVVESAEYGGSLITADLAQGYSRDVFAVPGRIGDEFSFGCNQLIQQNKAALLTNAEAFVEAMNWDKLQSLPAGTPIQTQLFPELSDEEKRVVKLLGRTDGKQINTLVIESNIPINRLNALLFELEMKGVVKALTGGMYRLVN